MDRGESQLGAPILCCTKLSVSAVQLPEAYVVIAQSQATVLSMFQILTAVKLYDQPCPVCQPYECCNRPLSAVCLWRLLHASTTSKQRALLLWPTFLRHECSCCCKPGMHCLLGCRQNIQSSCSLHLQCWLRLHTCMDGPGYNAGHCEARRL